MISAKQQEANRENAQHSTGPKTPEGKAAVRLNALTYGLRAKSLLLPFENPEEYQQLWADLEADWQPRNRTERLHLEQMATSQWLIARMGNCENRIYQQEIPIEAQLALLDRISVQRTRLERSFADGMRALEHLQQNRPAQPQPPAEPEQAAATPPPKPVYVMPDPAETHPGFSSPAATDTR